ncbi:MAG: nucleoside monophosphate kinase [Patescibacteria group bacterium]|nr:nucleoside monophosphate kinase [Patescibacteria group bacterium]
MKQILIFIGPPGSGKGTQAKKIAEKYKYRHVSTGDLIRALPNDPTATPEELKIVNEVSFAGRLVPDWFICGLVFRAVERYVKLSEYKGIVFDGAVRTLEQAERIQQYLETKDLDKEVAAVAIMISDKEAFDRLTKRRVCSSCREIIPWNEETKNITACPKCGGELKIRPDDKEEVIKTRMVDQGSASLQPILDYYQKIGVLKIIDGMQSIDAVGRDVEKALL